MSRGHIRQRGKDSWQLKFDAGRDPLTGNRRIEYVTFRGSKRSAQRELNRLLSEVDSKGYVPQQGTTVGEYARRWLDEIAAQTVSPRTWQRYEELVEHHITPHIGRCRIQDLDGSHIDSLYARLRREGRRDGKGGLSETTVRHIHRVLALIVKSAIKARVIRVNPMEAVQATPRNTKADIQILEDSEVSKLLGPSSWLRWAPVCVEVRFWDCAGRTLILIAVNSGSVRLSSKPKIASGSRSLRPHNRGAPSAYRHPSSAF
jgi:integrase